MPTTHPKIPLIAEAYFEESGAKKVKGLLGRMGRSEIGIFWLRDVFCRMATKHPEFELPDWEELICDESGRAVPYEVLFQIRLKLANLYRVAGTQEGEKA